MNAKHKNVLLRVTFAVAVGLGSVCAANATVYQVSQTIGGGGVTGTITTNGSFGVLSASDIIAWNLMLTGNGGATLQLVNGPSGVLVGNISDPFNPTAGTPDLTADAQHIYFNFDATDGGYLGFQVLPFFGGHSYWCNAANNNNFDCSQGKSVVPVFHSDVSSIYQTASGNQILATAVPEPMTSGLLLAGLMAVGCALRRTRRAAQV